MSATATSPAVLNVLVADDNHDAADTLALLLEMWGFHVAVAYDGNEALDACNRFPADCLLININMPRLDGCSVAQALKRDPKLCNARLIALTAFSDESNLRRIWQSGFHGYLNKPADPERIKEMIDKLAQEKLYPRNSA